MGGGKNLSELTKQDRKKLNSIMRAGEEYLFALASAVYSAATTGGMVADDLSSYLDSTRNDLLDTIEKVSKQ